MAQNYDPSISEKFIKDTALLGSKNIDKLIFESISFDLAQNPAYWIADVLKKLERMSGTNPNV